MRYFRKNNKLVNFQEKTCFCDVYKYSQTRFVAFVLDLRWANSEKVFRCEMYVLFVLEPTIWSACPCQTKNDCENMIFCKILFKLTKPGKMFLSW